jgi:hypothetical protein
MWQTEAQLHIWSPEVYQAVDFPITVSRKVRSATVDSILDSHDTNRLDVLRRYLHFDFDVEIGLREIGWGLLDSFKPKSKPAQIRARNDSGKPVPPDRAQFCFTCCAERINWPTCETRDLQNEAEEEVCTESPTGRNYKGSMTNDS